MTPEPTEDDRRRHAKAQADLAALSDVEKQLREHNKRWFSLGAGWHFRKSTEGVTVWLNPVNQEEDQYGWYTLAELREWAEDKGPVKNVRQRQISGIILGRVPHAAEVAQLVRAPVL